MATPVRRSTAPVPPVFLPHALAMLAGLLVAVIPDAGLALEVLAVVSGIYALYVVGSRGRAFLTPSGVYFLASGVFIGLAAHYLHTVGSLNELPVLRDWAVVAFTTTTATAMVLTGFSIRWKLHWPSRADLHEAGERVVPQAPELFWVIAVSLVGVSQIPQVRALNITLATAVGLAGVVMLVLVASSRRVKMRWHGDIVLVAMAVVVPLVWIQLEFEGGGRLTLAGMGIASLLAWNLVRPRRIQKVAVVLAIPLFLIYSGLNRLEQHGNRDTSSKSVLTSGEGLSSMYGPLDTWTELATVDRAHLKHTEAGPIGPRYGRTFLNTLFLPIPRSVWEDKPLGFGAELTRILRPTLLRQNRISEEHSMAALINGEFYVNFGLAGMVLLPLVMGWFLAVLDRFHLRLARSGLRTVDDWWRATILVCLVTSLGDLFWVGSFTFMARGGMAAIMAWAVWRFTTRRQRAFERRAARSA
ncbi:MAG: hypothetical protein R2746_08225 [Acidimicrobiales bacterium]